MANATYDNLWQQAVDELSEQLHVEGVDEENEVRLEDSTCRFNLQLTAVMMMMMMNTLL